MENLRPINGNDKIREASDAIKTGVDRFENAMDQLAKKLESSAQNIHRIKQAAQRPKELAMELKQTLSSEVESMAPYYSQAKDYSRRILSEIKSLPKPVLYGALGIIGALVLFGVTSERRSRKELTSERQLH